MRRNEQSKSTSSFDDNTTNNDNIDYGAQTMSSETQDQEASSLYIDVNLPSSRSDASKAGPLAASLLDQPPPGFIPSLGPVLTGRVIAAGTASRPGFSGRKMEKDDAEPSPTDRFHGR